MKLGHVGMQFNITPEMVIEPRRFKRSAWLGHVPFAYFLLKRLKPRTLVELGTFAGVSYSAFCEIIEKEELDTKCYAVDTWKGDPHAGNYSESVYEEFNNYHEQQPWSFSMLLRMTFDEAVKEFSSGSIDLLHIDGFHTYEAVSHDFFTWQEKLSNRSVVLFHDISSKNPDFGVKRFWDEIRVSYPHISFGHSAGLGVLGYGNQLPPQIMEFFSYISSPANEHLVLKTFQRLGDALQFRQRNQDLNVSIDKLNEKKNKIKSLQGKALQDLSVLQENNKYTDEKIKAVIEKISKNISEISRYT
jgi:hypothetical protein